MGKQYTSTIIGLGVIPMLTLTVLSLLTRRYFSLSNLEEVIFGLSGCLIGWEFKSYTSLMDSCDSSDLPLEICSDLENVRTAGIALKIVLVLDLVTLVCFFISLVISKAIIQPSITKALAHGLEGIESLQKKKIMKVYKIIKLSLILHPLLVLTGILMWVLLCKFNEMNGNVIIEDGIFILIVSFFFAMFGTAIYFYHIKQLNKKNKKKINDKIKNNTYDNLIVI